MQSIVNLRDLGFVATTVIKVFFFSSMVSELEIGLENGSMWTLQTRGVTSFMSATKHWSEWHVRFQTYCIFSTCSLFHTGSQATVCMISQPDAVDERSPLKSGWCFWFMFCCILQLPQESTVSNKTEPFVGLGPLGKRFKGTSDCFCCFAC